MGLFVVANARVNLFFFPPHVGRPACFVELLMGKITLVTRVTHLHKSAQNWARFSVAGLMLTVRK